MTISSRLDLVNILSEVLDEDTLSSIEDFLDASVKEAYSEGYDEAYSEGYDEGMANCYNIG